MLLTTWQYSKFTDTEMTAEMVAPFCASETISYLQSDEVRIKIIINLFMHQSRVQRALVSQGELGMEGRRITAISFLYGFIVQESFQAHFHLQYNYWPTISSFSYMKQVAFMSKLSTSTHMAHLEGPELAFFFSIFFEEI